MLFLKQSTAATVLVGPFINADGITPETGLFIVYTSVRLSKAFGTLANKNDTSAATHDQRGFYKVPLNATDTNTMGSLQMTFSEEDVLPMFVDYEILPANVFNSLFGTDKLEVDTVQISGGSQAADSAESFFDGTGYAGTNNVIPTVINVTNEVDANVVKLGGVTQSLTDLKDFADAGYDPVTNKVEGVKTVDDTTDVTNGVTLANASIKAVTYDESTAFPIKSVDTGSTQIARTGADGDTLEDLSDEIGAVAVNVIAVSDKVDEVHSDTDQIVVKLPTNEIMGSSVKTDKDDEIDAIKAKTDNLPADPASETNVDATEAKVDIIDTNVDAIKAKTDNLPADPASETNVDATEAKVDIIDTNVDAIKAKTDNLPADPASETNIDATEAKVDIIDTNVDAIKAVTDVIPNSGAMTDIDTGINNIEAKLPSKGYITGSDNADGDVELDDSTGAFPGGAFANHPSVDLGSDQSGVTIGTVNDIGTAAKAAVNTEMVDVLFTDLNPEITQSTPPAEESIAASIARLRGAEVFKGEQDTNFKRYFNSSGTEIWKKQISSKIPYIQEKGEVGS